MKKKRKKTERQTISAEEGGEGQGEYASRGMDGERSREVKEIKAGRVRDGPRRGGRTQRKERGNDTERTP